MNPSSKWRKAVGVGKGKEQSSLLGGLELSLDTATQHSNCFNASSVLNLITQYVMVHYSCLTLTTSTLENIFSHLFCNGKRNRAERVAICFR